MNINPLIESIFANFIVDTIQIPIFFAQYVGKDEQYLTYYSWLEQGYNFADDRDEIQVTFGTVDVWSKNNFKNIVEAVKTKLKENDFIWTDNGPEEFETETGYYHVPVNFYVDSSVTNITKI